MLTEPALQLGEGRTSGLGSPGLGSPALGGWVSHSLAAANTLPTIHPFPLQSSPSDPRPCHFSQDTSCDKEPALSLNLHFLCLSSSPHGCFSSQGFLQKLPFWLFMSVPGGCLCVQSQGRVEVGTLPIRCLPRWLAGHCPHSSLPTAAVQR